MKQRIFIAINLPREIKEVLGDFQNKYPELPARWTKPENNHITLIFIGYADEQEILEIKQVVQNIILRYKPFSIALDKISYGPPKIMPPRMVWALGPLPKEFLNLKNDLQKELAEKIRFMPEKRETVLHITLARIKEWEWRKIEPEERPQVDENIDLKFAVNSIELMKSVLKRGGPEYKILQSYNLKPAGRP